MTTTLMAFGCGFALGVVLSRRVQREQSAHSYQPTAVEQEIASCLEPQDLGIGAYLCGPDLCAVVSLKEQQPS